jgi:formylglycine-generating enzyme required for sulfatase activity
MIYSLSLQAQPRYALVIGNSNYNEPGKTGYLTNPINDAKDMKALLTNQLGFSVIEGYDVNQMEFNRLIQKFNKRLRNSKSPAVALFYFSGHGFSGKDQGDNETNYLVPLWPKNAPPTDQVSLEYSSISSNYIVTSMRRYNKNGVNMMVLDACRGSPKGFVQNYQEEDKGNSRGGFVNMDSRGVFLAYATALGRSSYGSTDTRNSIYTGKLLEVLKERAFWSKNITEVFNETAFRVAKFTEHYQEPWFSASGVKFCFESCLQSYVPQKSDISSDISQMLRTCQRHFDAYRLTTGVGGTALDCYSKVLKKDPNNAEALAGLEKIKAKYVAWIESALSRKQKERAKRYMAGLRLVNPESPKLREFEDRLSEQSFSVGEVFRDRLKDGSQGPEMVWIAAGSFQMGDIQGNGRSNEKPVHRVSITQDFGMGRYEVTVGEFRQFVNATGYRTEAEKEDGCYIYKKNEGWSKKRDANWRNPNFSQNDNHPVVCISWNDAVAYAEWLSQQTGKTYRLPTEAEWEYVARAGTTTKYWWGNTASHEYANYGADSCCSGLAKGKDRWEYTAPVSSFAPNQFGIYNTAGNVWEWTQDIIYSSDYYKNSIYSDPTGPSTGSNRVYRGGGWNDPATSCRAARRDRYSPDDRSYDLGFRLLRMP